MVIADLNIDPDIKKELLKMLKILFQDGNRDAHTLSSSAEIGILLFKIFIGVLTMHYLNGRVNSMAASSSNKSPKSKTSKKYQVSVPTLDPIAPTGFFRLSNTHKRENKSILTDTISCSRCLNSFDLNFGMLEMHPFNDPDITFHPGGIFIKPDSLSKAQTFFSRQNCPMKVSRYDSSYFMNNGTGLPNLMLGSTVKCNNCTKKFPKLSRVLPVIGTFFYNPSNLEIPVAIHLYPRGNNRDGGPLLDFKLADENSTNSTNVHFLAFPFKFLPFFMVNGFEMVAYNNFMSTKSFLSQNQVFAKKIEKLDTQIDRFYREYMEEYNSGQKKAKIWSRISSYSFSKSQFLLLKERIQKLPFNQNSPSEPLSMDTGLLVKKRLSVTSNYFSAISYLLLEIVKIISTPGTGTGIPKWKLQHPFFMTIDALLSRCIQLCKFTHKPDLAPSDFLLSSYEKTWLASYYAHGGETLYRHKRFAQICSVCNNYIVNAQFYPIIRLRPKTKPYKSTTVNDVISSIRYCCPNCSKKKTHAPHNILIKQFQRLKKIDFCLDGAHFDLLSTTTTTTTTTTTGDPTNPTEMIPNPTEMLPLFHEWSAATCPSHPTPPSSNKTSASSASTSTSTQSTPSTSEISPQSNLQSSSSPIKTSKKKKRRSRKRNKNKNKNKS